ncbi:hypothetical protein LSUB1_G001253 [Lachnellula subtilissima]|uniref:Uncharacterized protein n=1 Tax=Lachnellula subtilissima TaxID=602034 RepID=A0A8H8RZI3_9HELO|nr:hypothetical protein LSUB1_G001253 [Lachnellula subtilissima]
MASIYNILVNLGNALFALCQYLYKTISNTLFKKSPRTIDMAQQFEKQASPQSTEATLYQPSVEDVLQVKQSLFKELHLPIELVEVVIDVAEYWPHTTSVTTNDADHPISVRSGANFENQFLLRTFPLGYVPNGDNPTTLIGIGTHSDDHITLDKAVKSSDAPKPWPPSLDVQDDDTKELLERWTAVSMSRGTPCRKIVFTLKSHDQGWGGSTADKGTYRGSYSWFDVGLERISASRAELMKIEAPERTEESVPLPEFLPLTDTKSQEKTIQATNPVICSLRTILPRTFPKHPSSEDYQFEHALLPQQNCLQKNLTAQGEAHDHVVTWSCDDNILPESVDGTELEKQGRGRETATGQFVKDMKVGDVVTVWAKARFPGWVNVVEQVKVEVYWAV